MAATSEAFSWRPTETPLNQLVAGWNPARPVRVNKSALALSVKTPRIGAEQTSLPRWRRSDQASKRSSGLSSSNASIYGYTLPAIGGMFAPAQ